MSGRLATLAVLAIVTTMSGGVSANPPAPPVEKLFDCRDKDWSVQLLGTPTGKLVLATNRLSGPPGTGNVASDWQEVREGYVIGQGGGHQGHIRLFDGHRQVILFEGSNGELTDSPGETYAGATSETKSDPAQDFYVRCAATELNANLLPNVRGWAERVGVPVPEMEDEGSEYDGWF